MATCGTCGREIIWATDPHGETIAIDKTTSIKGEDRYTLEFPDVLRGGRPDATPIARDREFAAHPAHASICGQPHAIQ